MNSHVNPSLQKILSAFEAPGTKLLYGAARDHGKAFDPIKQALDRIAEIERDNAAKAKTIALREQNIRDLESERDELVEVMFAIVDHKGIAGTAAHTSMREVLKRLGYDHSDDAREG
jgi:hypothetical protein